MSSCIAIRAGIESLGGYFAHADQQGLLNFATRMRHWPQDIRLVRGEEKAKRELAAALRQRYRDKGKALQVTL